MESHMEQQTGSGMETLGEKGFWVIVKVVGRP